MTNASFRTAVRCGHPYCRSSPKHNLWTGRFIRSCLQKKETRERVRAGWQLFLLHGVFLGLAHDLEELLLLGSGSSKSIVCRLRRSNFAAIFPGIAPTVAPLFRSEPRKQPGRVNLEALREEPWHTDGTNAFSGENFSRFPPLAVPRAGLEPDSRRKKP